MSRDASQSAKTDEKMLPRNAVQGKVGQVPSPTPPNKKGTLKKRAFFIWRESDVLI